MPRPFPLAAVLRMREYKENLEERALSECNAAVHRKEAALAHVKEQLEAAGMERIQELRGVLLATHHQALAAKWNALREQQGHLLTQLHALEAKGADQRARFLQARRDREMLTDLNAKHSEVSRMAEARRQQKQIDDLTLIERVRK